MAFPDGWSPKWPIAVNADSVISSPVADWPCLVTDQHFPAGAWALMNADGSDLRFSSDEAGASELYYDDPRLDVAGEEAHLYVGVPSLASGADTTIYAWVGNAEASAPSAAWKQNTYPATYLSWWPKELTSGLVVPDRTVNGSDGDMADMTENDWQEDADGTRYLKFVNNIEANKGDPARVEVYRLSHHGCYWTGGTAQCVFRQPSDRAIAQGVIIGRRLYLGWAVSILSGGSLQLVVAGDTTETIDAPGDYQDDAWHGIAVTFTGDGVVELYVDGSLVDTVLQPDNMNADDGNHDVLLGAKNWGGHTSQDHGSDVDIMHSAWTVIGSALGSDQVALYNLMLSDPATWATAGALEVFNPQFGVLDNRIVRRAF